MSIKKYTIILFMSMLISSCGNYTEKKFVEEKVNLSEIETLSLSFKSVRKVFLDEKCIICHAQYNNYENVVQELTSIKTAIETNRMPKNGAPLSSVQKAVFIAWITKGAPENAGEVIKLPPMDSLEANWKSINLKIITPKCLVCHNPRGQANFLDLSSRQAIFENRNRKYGEKFLIDFEEPEESYLLEILDDPEEPMPPKWSNIARLKEEEIRTISQWISLGLP